MESSITLSLREYEKYKEAKKYIEREMINEIETQELQSVLIKNWRGGVLSMWIDIVKSSYPSAIIVNYYGSTKGRINGVLYDFIENKMWNDAPMIIKSYKQKP